MTDLATKYYLEEDRINCTVTFNNSCFEVLNNKNSILFNANTNEELAYMIDYYGIIKPKFDYFASSEYIFG